VSQRLRVSAMHAAVRFQIASLESHGPPIALRERRHTGQSDAPRRRTPAARKRTPHGQTSETMAAPDQAEISRRPRVVPVRMMAWNRRLGSRRPQRRGSKARAAQRLFRKVLEATGGTSERGRNLLQGTQFRASAANHQCWRKRVCATRIRARNHWAFRILALKPPKGTSRPSAAKKRPFRTAFWLREGRPVRYTYKGRNTPL
jgi:hypothetical protein